MGALVCANTVLQEARSEKSDVFSGSRGRRASLCPGSPQLPGPQLVGAEMSLGFFLQLPEMLESLKVLEHSCKLCLAKAGTWDGCRTMQEHCCTAEITSQE